MDTRELICGLYTRVSSRRQLHETYGSLEGQRERLEDYCKNRDRLRMHKVYEERAYSGESLNRPAMAEMIRDICSGVINCVLVYKIDRLTRSIRDFFNLLDIFNRYDVELIVITQPFDASSPSGRLLRNVMLEFAQFEREMIADRTRDTMEQRAQKGLWNGGISSYGYAVKDKQLVVSAEEARRVKFMFERFAATPSLAKLRDELNARGWRTRSGNPWGKTSVDHILRNPRYCGWIRSNDQLHKGIHKPIVSQRQFRKVQALRPDHSHPRTRLPRAYLLKGLLKCGDCGSFMTPHYTEKRRKDGSVNRIPYYRCTKTMHFNNRACGNRAANADLIERLIVEDLTNLSKSGSVLDTSIEALNQDTKRNTRPLENERKAIKKRISEIESEIGNYIDALGKADISLKRLETEIQKRQKQQETLRSQLEELDHQLAKHVTRDYDAEIVRRHLQDFQGTFEALTPEERTEALQCVLKDVVLYPDKLVLNIYELPELKRGSQNRTSWLPGRNPLRNVLSFSGGPKSAK